MKPFHKYYVLPPLHLLLVCLLNSLSSNVKAQSSMKHNAFNTSVSAVFVFGDSTVDPGNNNYIPTVFRSNFPPYGKDFVNQMPTGRFTNGRLTTDFIISYVGIKEYVPPYLDPNLSMEELVTGVSFASAGSGYDPLSATIGSVIQMSKQVQYLREYKARVKAAIGKQNTDMLMKKALFISSAGTNDFINNYFGLPIRRESYNISSYQLFLMQHVRQFIQSLWDEGARRIALVGLPPMGCLPVVITLNSNDGLQQRGCFEKYNAVATDYNRMLQSELKSMQSTFRRDSHGHDTRIVYTDIYGPLIGMIRNPSKYGLVEVGRGCCGTGLFEASWACNLDSVVCPDVSKYLFWDAIHPSEEACYIIFKTLRPTIDYIKA